MAWTIPGLAAALLLAACSGDNGANPSPSATASSSATASPGNTGPVVNVPVCAPSTSITATTQCASTSASPARPPASSSAASNCSPQTSGWNTSPKQAEPINHRAITKVRAESLPCSERLVFDIQGPNAVGYDVDYVQLVYTMQGDPLQVAPGALLRIGVRAPALGYETVEPRSSEKLAKSGDRLNRFESWGAFRELWFTGSFESHSGFALVLDAKRSYTVTTSLQGQSRQLIIEVSRP